MSIGSDLRAARERMRLTPSDVAAATRTKTPIIEAIELDDFSSFAAPIYAKGFIRLYAQYVGLDPHPLLDAYAGQVSGAKRPSLISDEAARARELAATAAVAPAAPAPSPLAEAAAPVAPPPADYDLFNAAEERRPAPPPMVEPRPPGGSVARERLAAAGELVREVWINWTQSIKEALRPGAARVAGIKTERDPWTLLPVAIGIVVVLLFVVSGLSRCARVSREASILHLKTEPGVLQLAVEPPEPYVDTVAVASPSTATP